MLAIILSVLARLPVPEGAELDFDSIDRRIAVEPSYRSEPLYALFLFGPDCDVRVWAVLDCSAPPDGVYDVLHFDLNADGDLTGPGERIVGERRRNPEGVVYVGFDVPSFCPPGQEKEHTALRFLWSPKRSTLRMLRSDGLTVSTSLEIDGRMLQFAPTRARAPVIVPGLGRPVLGRRFGTDPLSAGEEIDVKVCFGSPGSVPQAFSVLDYEVKGERGGVWVTLVYRDQEGARQELKTQLLQRC